MKRPKIKEAKEYFKNAKIVQICNSYREIEVRPELFVKTNCNGINEAVDGKLLMTGNDYNCVWSDSTGYAKILTYKEPKEETFVITSKQLNGLCEEIKISPASAVDWIHDNFPSAFVEDKKELVLEAGKWYKTDACQGSLFCTTSLVDKANNISGYGFEDGEWFNESKYYLDANNAIEATDQEVKSALEKEAVKRGFVKGIYIKELFYPNEGNYNEQYDNNQCSDEEFIITTFGLFIGNLCIFHDGIWAEIVKPKQMTQSDIEKELGYLIEIV